MSKKTKILFINMAKGFGGGEFQSEELMKNLPEYDIYVLGKKNSKFINKLKKYSFIKSVNFWEALHLILFNKKIIIHAQDGRGAHIANIFKLISRKPMIITRHVNFNFKRKSSLRSYQNANIVIGVSEEITKKLSKINSNSLTIYNCIKKSKENHDFEKKYLSSLRDFNIAHIGNFLPVKNFELTIEVAKEFPHINFYLVGQGILEQKLKEQSSSLKNVYFIPFTPYIGSIFKNMTLQILPSHSEGFGGVILEGYQYNIPVIAHSTGGIPEIVNNNKTGYLIQNNITEEYKQKIIFLLENPMIIQNFKSEIKQFMSTHNFTAENMANNYKEIYKRLIK